MKRCWEQHAEFIRGFAAAVATLAREHDQPSVAVDVMSLNGISFKDLTDAHVEEFDLRPLREEWKVKERQPGG